MCHRTHVTIVLRRGLVLTRAVKLHLLMFHRSPASYKYHVVLQWPACRTHYIIYDNSLLYCYTFFNLASFGMTKPI